MSTLEEEEITPDEIEAVASVPSKRFKPDPVEDEDPIPDFTIQDVAYFLVERQKVWYNKEILGLPDGQLTEDPVLREWRICNIFREQDAGTRYLIKLLDDLEREPIDQTVKLLNVMLYRLINRATVWQEYVGSIRSALDVKSAFERIKTASGEGVSVGTNTWRATSLSNLESQAMSLVDGLDEIYAICCSAKELRTVHAVLSRGYGIGEFVAYQIAVDLKLLFPALNNDDWIFVGGRGSRGKDGHGGSMWMLRRLSLDTTEDAIDVAKRLRDTQREWVPSYLDNYSPPRMLTLEDIDNLACEFRKYWFKLHGHGRALRRYGPEPVKEARQRASTGRRGSGRGTRVSESQHWSTPPELFKQLNEEFFFTVDAAAADNNHLLPEFWTPETDGLSQSWFGQRVYAFPPMHELGAWTEKAKTSTAISVILSPAYTETRWFYENVVHGASEVRFIRGMVQFWEDGEPRDNVFQNAVAILVYGTEALGTQKVDLAYTYPGRVPVARAGWTGWTE